MEKNQIPQELQESLKRYRELLGYDVEKGKLSLTERNHKPYVGYTDYADDTEDKENPDFDFGGEGDKGDTAGDDKEGGDNADFDFGGEEGGDTGGDTGEEGGDNADFDFGGEEGGDNADFDFGGEEGGDTEEDTDEFGTADEFSAADDIETDEEGDVEEIDVTDIVKRADDAKDYAQKAVTASEEGTNMIKDLMGKFQELEKSLGAINTIGNEVNSIKKDLQAQRPKEKLELRSLDSYPFNVKLTDYWNDEKLKDNYEITDGSTPDAQSPDGQVNVWKVTPEDTKTWNQGDIKNSFIPESKLKKQNLTEDGTCEDGGCGGGEDEDFENTKKCPKCGKPNEIESGDEFGPNHCKHCKANLKSKRDIEKEVDHYLDTKQYGKIEKLKKLGVLESKIVTEHLVRLKKKRV